MIIKPPNINDNSKYDIKVNDVYFKVKGGEMRDDRSLFYHGKLFLNGQDMEIPETINGRISIIDKKTEGIGTVIRVYNSENLSMCELPIHLNESMYIIFNITDRKCNIETYIQE